MTARVLLVRHGATDAPPQRLSGPPPGPPLGSRGVEQARALTERLRGIAMIYASPYRRTRETAEIVARGHGVAVELDDGLAEVPFGLWSGCDVDRLAGEQAWADFNTMRTVSPIPGGGLMLGVQARAVEWLARAAAAHAGAAIAAVSHADVIRALVAACAGISLDLALRLTIAPASISELHVGPGVMRIERVNDTAHLENLPQ